MTPSHSTEPDHYPELYDPKSPASWARIDQHQADHCGHPQAGQVQRMPEYQQFELWRVSLCSKIGISLVVVYYSMQPTGLVA